MLTNQLSAYFSIDAKQKLVVEKISRLIQNYKKYANRTNTKNYGLFY